MGGATRYPYQAAMASAGLSPRGRGNRLRDGRRVAQLGSIPAWAGQPSSTWTPRVRISVYPRVGGATLNVDSLKLFNLGLDPAWAGQPSVDWAHHGPGRVYPRVGGATRRRNCFGYPRVGGAYPLWVYPRVGGATGAACSLSWAGHHTRPVGLGRWAGQPLSPRGRGNPLGLLRVPYNLRSIPAWAGQPASACCLEP